jgi:hypothetical protein
LFIIDLPPPYTTNANQPPATLLSKPVASYIKNAGS